eukprot:scaffold4502_cov119-Isochrysis_galbana.AAC.1
MSENLPTSDAMHGKGAKISLKRSSRPESCRAALTSSSSPTSLSICLKVAEPKVSGSTDVLEVVAQNRIVQSMDETGTVLSSSEHSAMKAMGPSCAEVPCSSCGRPSGARTRAARQEEVAKPWPHSVEARRRRAAAREESDSSPLGPVNLALHLVRPEREGGKRLRVPADRAALAASVELVRHEPADALEHRRLDEGDAPPWTTRQHHRVTVVDHYLDFTPLAVGKVFARREQREQTGPVERSDPLLGHATKRALDQTRLGAARG